MRVHVSRRTGLLAAAVLAIGVAVAVPAQAGPTGSAGPDPTAMATPTASSSPTASPTTSSSPTAGPTTSSGTATTSAPAPTPQTAAAKQHPAQRTCPAATAGHAECLSMKRTDVTAHKGLSPQAVPAGYAPADLQDAYGLPSGTAGSGATVAIVDAFDDPNAEADLALYRTQYNLPPCTTDNGCFRKVAQDGSPNYPPPNQGWSTEISLDVDMVSAICPACHILLVEATDNSIDNLALAVDEAVALGAQYVSNSYGATTEDPSETSYDKHYDHPGTVITASSGDDGYGVQYPAASPGVTAVGGTHLVRDSGTARGWAETVWSGAGSGCSQFETKAAWQADSGCGKRTVADVSAVADPATGVAVYDTYQEGGWLVFGGTSVAAPIIASTYALAGAPHAGTTAAQYPYDAALVDASGLNDVTSGKNGSCQPAYLCTGEPGYDGPTGLGTPHGVGAFGYRAHGDLVGTVTDSTTGGPVAGATVAVPGRSTTTDAAGHYDLNLPAGSFSLTVSAYGYQNAAADGVAITAGQITTRDVALTALPRATVSGTVTDGSGHGWALYAKVSWDDGTGHTGATFTDPATGHYALRLLENTSYQLHVQSVYPGYLPVDKQVDVAAADLTEDVTLSVDAVACTAPGYSLSYRGATETFTGSQAPDGWRVSNVDHHWPGYVATPGWVFTDAGGRGNTTGGSGGFAIVDSDHTGAHHYQDTYLESPGVDLSGDASPGLQLSTDLQPAVNSTASIDLSIDNGRTWTTVWTAHGFPGDPGPASIAVALPAAAHKTAVRVRLHYTGSWSRWWEVDDLFLGNRSCGPTSGGLLVGRVTDATGSGLVGAKVASVAQPDESTTTVATPDDPATGDGLYWLFTTATGSQRFTAADAGYATTTNSATITAGQVSTLDFTLSSG